jgi:DeoR/GlpR family transcriptional regulator of sugar metabolism
MYHLIMSSLQRHERILNRLNRDGKVDVTTLSEEFEISEVTIRRDLERLAEVGALRRTRGGAVSIMKLGEGLPFALREIERPEVKQRLASAAAALISDGEAVALDSGTTCVEVAKAVAARRLTIMPFSVQGISALFAQPGINLITPGGSVRQDEGSIVGPLAEASLTSVRFDVAIISPCGAAADSGVMAHDLQDAAVKKAIMAASKRTIMVADGAKFSRSAMAAVCPLNSVDVLVTDASAPSAVTDRLTLDGVQVVVV